MRKPAPELLNRSKKKHSESEASGTAGEPLIRIPAYGPSASGDAFPVAEYAKLFTRV